MKKYLCLILILAFLPIGNVFAKVLESSKIIMEQGTVGDTVKVYFIPPNDKDLYASDINLYYDTSVLEYIDSELLNTSGLSVNYSVINNCIYMNIEGSRAKQICLAVSFKIKKDGNPSFYLEECYYDRNFAEISERFGEPLSELAEKGSEIPVYVEPPFSEIEIFIRDKYVLFAEEHDMSGKIMLSAYNESGDLIDFTTFNPSKQIRTKPYSKAGYVKIMWWDKDRISPVCPAQTVYFK